MDSDPGVAQLDEGPVASPPDSRWVATKDALGRLFAAWHGFWAAKRRLQATKLLQRAMKMDVQTVMELSLAGAVAAGFTIFRDGKEYGVFIGKDRVRPASEARSQAGTTDRP